MASKVLLYHRKWMRDVEITISEWETIAYIEEEGQYSLLIGKW